MYTGITKPNTRNKKSWNWTLDPQRNLNKLPGCIQEELTSFSSCPLFGTLILAKYCVNCNVKATCGTSYHPRFQWSTPLSLGSKRSNRLFKFAELLGFHLTFQQTVGLSCFLYEQIFKWAEVNVPVSASARSVKVCTNRAHSRVKRCELSPAFPPWETQHLRRREAKMNDLRVQSRRDRRRSLTLKKNGSQTHPSWLATAAKSRCHLQSSCHTPNTSSNQTVSQFQWGAVNYENLRYDIAASFGTFALQILHSHAVHQQDVQTVELFVLSAVTKQVSNTVVAQRRFVKHSCVTHKKNLLRFSPDKMSCSPPRVISLISFNYTCCQSGGAADLSLIDILALTDLLNAQPWIDTSVSMQNAAYSTSKSNNNNNNKTK